jgi:hypothetical protein
MPQLVLRSGALTIDQHQQPSCCSKVRPVSDECQGLTAATRGLSASDDSVVYRSTCFAQWRHLFTPAHIFIIDCNGDIFITFMAVIVRLKINRSLLQRYQ